MSEIEKIKLLETLKAGSDLWLKGTVFDRKDGPFPSVVAAEIRAHQKGESKVIQVLMTRADVEEEEARIREVETAKAKAEADKKDAETALAKREEELQAVFKENVDLKKEIAGLKKELKGFEKQNDDLKKALVEAKKVKK